jgi:hypothetical protein
VGYHTDGGDEHASERVRELGELGAELRGVKADEIDEEMLRRDDRREGVRDMFAEEVEGM